MKGTCEEVLNGHVSLDSGSTAEGTAFPSQIWPLVDGKFTALVMLSSGPNKLRFSVEKCRTGAECELEVQVTYIPLLETPPLHLAIMIGKDSPLLIDCPPAKHGGISSTHSSLDAAIAKFRMTAYMWQAMTAEDMRMKGLQRRAFRLEEEWSADTTSSMFLNVFHEEELFAAGAMRATAKVHLIPSTHTVKEIRDIKNAQHNHHGRGRSTLHTWFTDAIQAYGKSNTSFSASARPVVAGLILDSHYSPTRDIILGHAALGAHNPSGLSLGIMGSHLTYAWPRFLEEVTSCLLDCRSPGDTVGNDSNECGTLWEACAIGQGAFLHEVGHAFGAPHTTGIMARGYPVHWPRNFVAKTAWCSRDNKAGFVVIENENEARWDLTDALGFALLPHFRLPGDGRGMKSQDVRNAAPRVHLGTCVDKAGNVDPEAMSLKISSPAGLVRIQWNKQNDPVPSTMQPISTINFGEKDLEARFPRDMPLHLSVLAMNGKETDIHDAWRLFYMKPFVRVPGADFVLHKRSVQANLLEEDHEAMDGQVSWTWAIMLQRRKADGTLSRATKVDVRTGSVLDGAYVYYDDETRVNCGPLFERSRDRLGRRVEKIFGGHASETVEIPEGQEITKVEVSRNRSVLRGLRFTLSDGTRGGKLSGGGRIPGKVELGEWLSSTYAVT